MKKITQTNLAPILSMDIKIREAYTAYSLFKGYPKYANDTIENFYKDFIGVFKTEKEFYDHIYEVPELFISNYSPIISTNLYYPLNIEVEGIPYDRYDWMANKHMAFYIAVFRQS
jgi:hypothetical protein